MSVYCVLWSMRQQESIRNPQIFRAPHSTLRLVLDRAGVVHPNLFIAIYPVEDHRRQNPSILAASLLSSRLRHDLHPVKISDAKPSDNLECK